jgi:hypothetical protein
MKTCEGRGGAAAYRGLRDPGFVKCPCALVAHTSCWCNGCSRLAPANKYYE